jgi:hypothetical protein
MLLTQESSPRMTRASAKKVRFDTEKQTNTWGRTIQRYMSWKNGSEIQKLDGDQQLWIRSNYCIVWEITKYR